MSFPTIAAIATPLASSGLGVVRMSGGRSQSIASAIFRLAGGQNPAPDRLDSHRLYYGHVYDGEKVVDEAMLVIMKGPHSFTGEDVVELQTHGGAFVLKTVLALLLKNGAEPAGPGEFTRRAFMNGKIDLTQAEAVADIIEAASDRALSAAAAQITGALKSDIRHIQKKILSVLAEIDAAADVEDHDGTETKSADMAERLTAEVLPEIDRLIDRHETITGSDDLIRVVLAGAPNVGKSTLLNRLLGKERAIVTSQPGTTRDVVDGSVVLRGRPFLFSDTAGLRDATDSEVEKIGMDRARQHIEQADLVVLMVDAAAGISSKDEALYEQLSQRPLIVAANKIDLLDETSAAVPRAWKDASLLMLSAKTGAGIPALEDLLSAACPEVAAVLPGEAIPNERHKNALVLARTAVISAIDALKQAVPADIAAIDLRTAWSALGEILGDNVRPDTLDSIFERFCVGK